MKALCVHQPFADWIVSGEKTVELRRWRTRYRGPIVICSTLSYMDPVTLRVTKCKMKPGRLYGYAIGTVEIVEVRRPDFPWDTITARAPDSFVLSRKWAWVLRKPRRYARAFPVTGRQGLFNL